MASTVVPNMNGGWSTINDYFSKHEGGIGIINRQLFVVHSSFQLKFISIGFLLIKIGSKFQFLVPKHD